MSDFIHSGVRISYEVVGSGPPVLLLHGFPQTRALWRDVAAVLAERFTLVMPDLRGYGASDKPPADPDHENYGFRTMGQDMIALMAHLGFERFHVAGHDRGGRVAYRMARDHADALLSLTVMDIVPTDHLLDHWSEDVAMDYFHWTFLAQAAPLPETLIGADPDAFYTFCLTGWGAARLEDFPAIDSYRAAWRDPDCIRGMTEDYRAAIHVDAPLDRAEGAGRVDLPALMLWGRDGAMARHFDVTETWAPRLPRMTARAMPGGHFFVDRYPRETAEVLGAFLAGCPAP